MKSRDEDAHFLQRYPNAKARRAADEATERAWTDLPAITLESCCVVWLTVYEEFGKPKGAST